MCYIYGAVYGLIAQFGSTGCLPKVTALPSKVPSMQLYRVRAGKCALTL